MAKSDFSIDKITTLQKLKPGAKIHVIGVCGVAMAQLSILLTRKGFSVSGSDKEFYEPMGSLLKSSAVKVLEGYKSENVPQDVDLVVIGNAVPYDHPEVKEVERRDIPYTCFPALLEQTIIHGRHSIVVAGTHGKSTTTAMIASVLNRIGEKPSYFVGGISQDLPVSLAEGKGRFSVVEGDEYDSSFFAKVPKFAFYKPDTAIINAIEYDHADIYPNLEAVINEFDKLARAVPVKGTLIVCADFKNIKDLLPVWRRDLKCKILTFGASAESDYRIKTRTQRGLMQSVEVFTPSGERMELKIPLIGEYNARNALATFIALSVQGLSKEKLLEALSQYRAVKRRQEIIISNEKATLIEDFAHHPTAVKQTLEAVREAFVGKKVWAVFEPRSATSRRKVFESEYVEALVLADTAIISEVKSRGLVDSGHELMDVNKIVAQLKDRKIAAFAFQDNDSIKNKIFSDLEKGAVLVVMSNGSFGGLIQELKAGLS